MNMTAKSLLVLSCAMAVFAIPQQQRTNVDTQCASENKIIRDYKADQQDVASPNLDGIYKFVLIYDPSTTSDDSIVMCLKTEYKELSSNPKKVDAKSYVNVFLETKVGDATQEKDILISKIEEVAEQTPSDVTYWYMEGTMTQVNSPIGEALKPPVSYSGDFNFFHNKDGIVGYSACSVRHDGKGIVLIVSMDSSVTREQIENHSSKQHKSILEAREKVEDIAKILIKNRKRLGETVSDDVDSFIYTTSSRCW